MAPAMICPSAPMFQNFILNASVTPSDAINSGIAIFTVAWMAIPLLRAPVIIVL